MKYKFRFQNANSFFFFFFSEFNLKVISFQIANYFYFHILINNDFIFKIQTIFTFKLNTKLAFMYKYQIAMDHHICVL